MLEARRGRCLAMLPVVLTLYYNYWRHIALKESIMAKIELSPTIIDSRHFRAPYFMPSLITFAFLYLAGEYQQFYQLLDIDKLD